MPVNYQHKQYTASLSAWKLVRDCVGGSSLVKGAGETYLPKPNPNDQSTENKERYNQYVKRAQFLDVTKHTKNGFVGAVFRYDPNVEGVDQFDYIMEDVDGSGTSLLQLGKWCVGELLETNRCGLLVDYSTSGPAATQAETKQLGRRAFIHQYRPESIINWRYQKVQDVYILSLVVLEEVVEVPVDLFASEQKKIYRVLGLDEAGNYYQEVYSDDGTVREPRVWPRDGKGGNWKRIPFHLLSADSDWQSIGSAPLLGIADLNIGHYRNSADYEEGVFMHGQGTLFLSLGAMTPEQFKALNPNGVLIGARAGIALGQGGSAQLVQMSANSAAREAMQDKEAQLIMLGARLISNQSQQKTAEEVRINSATETSVLDSVAGNASEGIEAALEDAAIFEGVDPSKIVFMLNRQFFDANYDPQQAAAKIMELDRGLITDSDYRDYLRRTGQLAQDRTDQQIEEEIAAAKASSGSMPDLTGGSA